MMAIDTTKVADEFCNDMLVRDVIPPEQVAPLAALLNRLVADIRAEAYEQAALRAFAITDDADLADRIRALKEPA